MQMRRLLAGGDPEAIVPMRIPSPSHAPSLPAITPPIGKERARVGILTGCVMRVLYGDVNGDTAAVLAANGCTVLVNQAQGCCGALHIHNGELERGKELARRLIDAFFPFDGHYAIVVNYSGCGSTMKEFGELLADDAKYADRAKAFASKVRDVAEFLDDLGWTAPLKPLDMTVTYHDACHLAHAQRITDAPRRLLALVPGLVVKPLDESDVCCGSAGIIQSDAAVDCEGLCKDEKSGISRRQAHLQ